MQKFTKNVNWCIDTGVQLSPTVLCQDIMQFPEAIEWCRQKTQEGVIYPDLHGWDHGPYGERTEEEIVEHLDKAMDWFYEHLDVVPMRWVTPHGAHTLEIESAARQFGLVVEDTSLPVIDQKALDPHLNKNRDLAVLDGKVIMNHWWERGLRLYRICKIIEHQSIEIAIDATASELSAGDQEICWSGW
jgi:hypothetical protein